jgi:hypothetical protein
MSFTKLSLGGNDDVIYKLFLLTKSLVNDISAREGNIEKLFYGVRTLKMVIAGNAWEGETGSTENERTQREDGDRQKRGREKCDRQKREGGKEALRVVTGRKGEDNGEKLKGENRK